MLRYLRVYALLARNSFIREMNFKVNFLLWIVVEILWFSGQILFIEVLFSHIETIGDWNKWQMIALVGIHQTIAQIFQAFFYVNLTHLPELIRTGKLDTVLTLPLDAQFAASTKQIGMDNLVNAGFGLGILGWALLHLEVVPTLGRSLLFAVCLLFGVAVHYSVLCSLSCLCFWITRAQGLVYAYFNLFNIGRYPDTVYGGLFRRVFTWVVPVVLVASVPARLMTRTAEAPWSGMLQLTVATVAVFGFTRWLWLRGLSRYSSASS